MRKTTRLFLSTLIAILMAGQLSSPYMALAATGAATEWTVAELLEYKEELVAAACDEGDVGCRMQTLYFLEWVPGQNAALITFLNQLFLVTTINPSAENLTVLYPAEDLMGGMLRSSDNDTVTSLYLGWFDEGQESLIYNYDYRSFTSGNNPSIHTIYAENTETKERGWIRAGEETRLMVPGSNLAQNTSGILGVAFESDSANMAGNIRYASCLTAQSYRDGMECRLVFNARGEQFYRPYAAPVLPEEPDHTETEPATPAPENSTVEGSTSPADLAESTPVDSPETSSEADPVGNPEESISTESPTPSEAETSANAETDESAGILDSSEAAAPSQEQPVAETPEELPLDTDMEAPSDSSAALERTESGNSHQSQNNPGHNGSPARVSDLLNLAAGSSDGLVEPLIAEKPSEKNNLLEPSSQAVAVATEKIAEAVSTKSTASLASAAKAELSAATTQEDIATTTVSAIPVASTVAAASIAASSTTEEKNATKETITASSAATSATTPVKASKTVELPAAGQETTDGFPWWIIIVVASGLGLALWWLLPSNRKGEKA